MSAELQCKVASAYFEFVFKGQILSCFLCLPHTLSLPLFPTKIKSRAACEAGIVWGALQPQAHTLTSCGARAEWALWTGSQRPGGCASSPRRLPLRSGDFDGAHGQVEAACAGAALRAARPRACLAGLWLAVRQLPEWARSTKCVQGHGVCPSPFPLVPPPLLCGLPPPPLRFLAPW